MKKILFFLALILVSKTIYAQGVEFMHDIGAKFFFYSNADVKYATTAVYSPRVIVSGEGNSSISVGTHLGFGFGATSGAGGDYSFLVLDAPLVGEYNFGHGATKEADAGFGGYIGGGYGFHHIGISDGGSVNIHGPVITGGIRFMILGASMGVGASYMFDLKNKDVKLNVLGASITYALGMGSGN